MKLKPIEEIYPGCATKYGFADTYDYNPLLESFGYKILMQKDDEDYQGDSRLLFCDDAGRYGLLIFGWGSCSGCDALQACDSYKQIEELRDRLLHEIKWFDGVDECLDYFNNHNWEGDYSWHYEETRGFVDSAKLFLLNSKPNFD